MNTALPISQAELQTQSINTPSGGPLLRVITFNERVVGVDTEGLFEALNAKRLHCHHDFDEDIAASGAAHALTTLTLALAARGYDVRDAAFTDALTQTLESLSNELS